MNVSKLKAALFDLQAQRMLIDKAISTLQGVIDSAGNTNGDAVVQPEQKAARPSGYVHMAVSLLEEAGKPIHIKEIAFRIGQILDKKVSRAAVESTLIRHMNAKSEEALVQRVAPGFFGLPQWGTLVTPLGHGMTSIEVQRKIV